jgi:hypothetical protein
MRHTAPVANTVIVYRARHSYCSHPCVVRLADSEWLVAFSESTQREPFLHPPNDPRYVNLLLRSHDRGESWEQPRVVPNYDWYGVETPGIAQLSNGDLLLNQWRFRWYPVELGRRLWRAGEAEVFVCRGERFTWRAAQSEADWEGLLYPWVRADDAAYVHISTNAGRTWELTTAVDIAPYRGAFSPKGAIELPDGDVLLALGSQDHDPLAASFVVRSGDRGRSWQAPVEVARAPGLVFSEPAAVATSAGTVLVFSREETGGFLYQSESTDGGRTWGEPLRLPLWGYPAHCIELADGRLVLVYGRRKPPFGIRASVSEDVGRTWGPELVLRDDLPNDNLGYPSVIEYELGKLFTVYYGEDAEGVTCIQGTYWSLKD